MSGGFFVRPSRRLILNSTTGLRGRCLNDGRCLGGYSRASPIVLFLCNRPDSLVIMTIVLVVLILTRFGSTTSAEIDQRER